MKKKSKFNTPIDFYDKDRVSVSITASLEDLIDIIREQYDDEDISKFLYQLVWEKPNMELLFIENLMKFHKDDAKGESPDSPYHKFAEQYEKLYEIAKSLV